MSGLKTIAVVFYRELPEELMDFVLSNTNISIVKDGVYKGINGTSPRLSVYWNGKEDAPKKVLKVLAALLKKLSSTDLIVSYTCREL